jgi:hypothetical protein
MEKMSFIDRMLHSAEKVISKSIPYVMVLLAVLIIAEFTVGLEHYEPWVSIIDYSILIFFILDLSFKFAHTKGFLKFVKLYWIEILAVFPFYLLFRVYAEFTLVGEGVAGAQQLTHEALLAREAQVLGRESAVLRETRLLRDIELYGRETTLIDRIVLGSQRGFRLVVSRLKLAHIAVVEHSKHHS